MESGVDVLRVRGSYAGPPAVEPTFRVEIENYRPTRTGLETRSEMSINLSLFLWLSSTHLQPTITTMRKELFFPARPFLPAKPRLVAVDDRFTTFRVRTDSR